MLHFSLFLEGVHLASDQEEVCFFRIIFFPHFLHSAFLYQAELFRETLYNAMGMKSHLIPNLPEWYIGSEGNTTLAIKLFRQSNNCPCVLKFD